MKFTPPDYIFCPFCGKKLSVRKEEGYQRKYCKKDNWTYYPRVTQSACAMIVNGKKVLLVKRKREPFKGYWMFPSGFLNFAEHPEDGLKREVYEETGLKVIDYDLVAIDQAEDDIRELGHLVFMYLVHADGKIKNLDKEENSDIKRFDLDNVPNNIGWKAHQKMMKWLQQTHPSSIKSRAPLKRG